jgi:hypothetical protein
MGPLAAGGSGAGEEGPAGLVATDDDPKDRAGRDGGFRCRLQLQVVGVRDEVATGSNGVGKVRHGGGAFERLELRDRDAGGPGHVEKGLAALDPRPAERVRGNLKRGGRRHGVDPLLEVEAGVRTWDSEVSGRPERTSNRRVGPGVVAALGA